MQTEGNNWHTLSGDDVAQRLVTHPESGLDAAQAAKRLAHYGANELKEKRARSP